MVKTVRRLAGLIIAVLVTASLSGCLYPDQKKRENQASVRESILLVQNAVDTYKQRTGVLPIKNSEPRTPIYEKYVLDMRKLKDGQYLSQPPGIAYENGGTAMFVLVDPETKPLVRIMDVVLHQQAGDIQNKVNEYLAKHQNVLPKGAEIAPRFYQLDFDKLGMKQQQAESRYSRQYLSYVINETGTIAIDYGPDLMKLITEKGLASSLNATMDLRTLLAQEYPYVPVKSYPYRWVGGQPTLSE
ncbi:hypothetical protein [Paenibacillus koleovorans]|uniref:hypothetical protein n=1 Tax=Paenibacillus koleovorans TaxID=121608 RepID=UPI000FD7909A|nr:hypothetical protein [Paenibacillus koleovorans]